MISRLLGRLRKLLNASRVSKHRMARFTPNAEIHEPHDELALGWADRMQFDRWKRRLHHAARRRGDHKVARRARAPAGPCSDEPLLLEAGGFRLELLLTIIVPSCAGGVLSQALWGFMLRFVDLVPLQRPALLAPPIISALRYPQLTGRIGNALTLCNQHVD